MNKIGVHKQGFFTLSELHCVRHLFHLKYSVVLAEPVVIYKYFNPIKIVRYVGENDEIILDTVFSSTILNWTLVDLRNKLNTFELRNEWKWIAQ